MGTVHEKLDEAMAEIEKLRAEYKIKAESSENFKRAYNEQLTKIREASSKVDKLTLELNLKEDELSVAKQAYEELKSNLKDKEAAIKSLRSANDRLRADCAEKLKKSEEENRSMAVALDETNAANMEQEQQIQTLRNEIDRLRKLAMASQKMSCEVEKRTRASKELRQRDDVLLKLEEENRELEDQLKWKKEQFGHLAEAHEKIRQQFREREKEWEKEKDTLFNEISTLQLKLDSQIRISEGLQSRLQMCNQALAHEESRRKTLEVELSESKTSLDNVSAEYKEAKSRTESLTNQRDKEIANLRDALGTREAIYKETEYLFRKLEQENRELMASLKELQEAGINDAGHSSLPKLRNKLKDLEQAHGECSAHLKTKESEWVSQLEGLAGELDCCKHELKNKNTLITNLQDELQACHSLVFDLALQNEETSLMLLVLRSHLSEVHQKLAANTYAAIDLTNKEEQNISTLKQLDQKNSDLVRTEKDLEEEREKVAMLLSRVESLNLIEEEQLPLQIEVDILKEMLKEASTHQVHLKEQVLKTKSELKEAKDALDRADEELAESYYEGKVIESELQIWRSVAERLQSSLDENHQVRREVEASLFAQVDVEFELRWEKDRLEHILADKEEEIKELQEQIVLLNEKLNKRETRALQSPLGKKNSLDLHKELECFEEEWLRKELEKAILAQVEAEGYHKKEKEILHHRIQDLQNLVSLLELQSENSTSSFSSRLLAMQAETDMFHKTWETVREALVLKEIEVQEKSMINLELENDLNTLQDKVTNLTSKLERLTCSSDVAMEKLMDEKAKAVEDARKLSSDREILLDMFMRLSNRISQLSMEDMELTNELGRIMQTCGGFGLDMKRINEFFDPAKENLNICSSPTRKVEAAMVEDRLPRCSSDRIAISSPSSSVIATIAIPSTAGPCIGTRKQGHITVSSDLLTECHRSLSCLIHTILLT
nr:uncharacterized protein At4g38062-like [Ipomoea batatas]